MSFVVPWPGIGPFGTYNGWAYSLPSKLKEKSLLNVAVFTFAGLRTVSLRLAPVRALSYPRVTTATWPEGDGDGVGVDPAPGGLSGTVWFEDCLGAPEPQPASTSTRNIPETLKPKSVDRFSLTRLPDSTCMIPAPRRLSLLDQPASR